MISPKISRNEKIVGTRHKKKNNKVIFRLKYDYYFLLALDMKSFSLVVNDQSLKTEDNHGKKISSVPSFVLAIFYFWTRHFHRKILLSNEEFAK